MTDLVEGIVLNELSKDTLSNYLDKADTDIVKAHRVRKPQADAGDKSAVAKTDKRIDKRMKGIDSANKRLGANESRFDNRDAYQRDYDSSVSGMGRPGRDWDEGNTEPPNNFAIYINGKKWKVLPGNGYHADDHREQAQHQRLRDMCAKKTAATGKKWSVHATGEAPTNESVAESATAGATSAGNVGVGAVYKNKKPKMQKPTDNALDGDNLMTGGSIKR